MSSAKLFIQLLVAIGVLLSGCTAPVRFNRPQTQPIDHTAGEDAPPFQSAPSDNSKSQVPPHAQSKESTYAQPNQRTIAHYEPTASATYAVKHDGQKASADLSDIAGDDQLVDLLQRTDPAIQTILAQQLSQVLADQRIIGEETAERREMANDSPVVDSRVQRQPYAVAPLNAAIVTPQPGVSTNEHTSSASSTTAITTVTSTNEPETVDGSRQDLMESDAQVARTTFETAEPEVPRVGDWRAQLARTIESLEQDLSDAKIDEEWRERAEVNLRLLYVVADEREKAVEPIEDLDETESEFWKQQLRGLSVYLSDGGTPREDHRANLALQHLRQAADQLSAKSSLELRNVAFCTQVESYGRYTKFKRYDFKANQEVILYVEVDNFTPDTRGAQGQYETALQGSYEIFDSGGRRVDEQTFPVEREVCSNRRRDFFIPYRMYMPKVAPGKYSLQLTVKDVIGDKFGQAPRIEFAIVK